MMKTIMSRSVAILTLALLSISSSAAAQQMTQAPMAKQPMTAAPIATQPQVNQPNAQQPGVAAPVPSINTYSSTGRTHGSVSANSGAYQVGITPANTNANFKQVNTRTYKGANGAGGSGSYSSGSSSSRNAAGAAVGGSPISGGSIGSRLFGSSNSSSYQSVNNKAIGSFSHSGFSNVQTSVLAEAQDGTDSGYSSNGPGGNGDGVVVEPLGNAILPLMILLLGYAAVRTVRKKNEIA